MDIVALAKNLDMSYEVVHCTDDSITLSTYADRVIDFDNIVKWLIPNNFKVFVVNRYEQYVILDDTGKSVCKINISIMKD